MQKSLSVSWQGVSHVLSIASLNILPIHNLAQEGGRTRQQVGTGLTGYALLNLVHDFDPSLSLAFSDADLRVETNQTRIEGKLGAEFSAMDSYQLAFFMEAGLSHSIDAYHDFSISGHLGINFKF